MNRREAPSTPSTLDTVMEILAVGGGLYLLIEYLDHSFTETKRLNQEKVSELGMRGDLPLIDLRTIPGFQNASGSLLLVNETIKGKTTQLLQFAWETNDWERKIIVSKIPVEKVQFKRADEVDAKPTVNFGLERLVWRHSNPNEALTEVGFAVFTIAEKDQTKFNLSSASK